MSLIEDCNLTTSTAYTLMACDQYRRGGDVIGSDMKRRRFCREGVKNILRKAGRKMPRHVVGIVRVGIRFATYHGDAGFDSRAR